MRGFSSGRTPLTTLGVVSTFPPARCGVGEYADEQVRSLEREGKATRRLDITPMQKGGWTLGRAGSVRRLFQAAKGCDEFVLHFQIWMYRDETRRNKLSKYLWPQLVTLWFLLRHGRRTTMVVHEYRYKLYHGFGSFLQYPLPALLFWLPKRLVFHTPQEVAGFRRTFGRSHGLAVRPHHADFTPRSTLTRAQARERLGLSPQVPIALTIGFYKVHKGFPALARSFARLAGRLPGAQLHFVTSIQDAGDTQARKELDGLRKEFEGHASVILHEEYPDSETFDVWILASDVVVLPYLAAYSSSVAARARILERPLIVRAAGGLATQAGESGAVYEDEAGLRQGLQRLLSTSR